MQADRFNNPKYINWIKVGLSLNHTKEGLVNYLELKAKAFHDKVKANVLSNNALAATSLCTRCHHTNIKKVSDKKTRLSKWNIKCPNNLCDVWLGEILKFHDHLPCPNVSWPNTNPQLWPSQPWEIIKCFQPFGCQGHTSARDSDCTALMTLLTDCTFFHQFISNKQIAREVKTIRNKTMHSADQEIEDTEMTDYINVMISLLEDPLQLLSQQPCQVAVEKLKELRDSVLNMSLITTQEQLIQQQQSLILSEEINHLRDEVGELKTTISETESESKESKAELHNKIKELEANLRDLEDVKMRIEDLGNSAHDIEEVKKHVDELNTSVEIQTREIQRHSDDIDALRKTFTLSDREKQNAPDATVKRCRQYLLQLYEGLYTEVPIYPLLLDETVPLDKIYVEPLIQVETSNAGRQSSGANVNSYRDILSPPLGKGDFNHNVYLLGEAGSGKTTFCQNMVYAWCKAVMNSDQTSEDEKFMLQFDLLFYIPLRSFRSFSDLESMIGEMMEQNMTDILKETRCLIILDGLDEWEPPLDYKPSIYITEGLPHRIRINRYTILTTTRNWKMEAIRPKSHEINLQLEIRGFDQQASMLLVEKVLLCLNDKAGLESSTSKTATDFFDEMKRNKMTYFTAAPVILLQLLCLWHDGQPFGNSQCQIYANVIDRQIQQAEQDKKLLKYEGAKEETLPYCFRNCNFCKRYSKFIMGLSELAYLLLFNSYRESSLVFTDKQTFGISHTDVEFGLKVGLLSQVKVFWKSTERSKSMNFIHKTHQEFLAAVYIGSRHPSDLRQIRNTCVSLDTFLEMSNVFLFVSGMNSPVGISVLDQPMQVVSCCERLREYRQNFDRLERNDQVVFTIQDIIIDIANEIAANSQTKVRLPLTDVVVNSKTICQLHRHLDNIRTETVMSLYVDTTDSCESNRTQLSDILNQLKLHSALQKLHIIDKGNITDIQELYMIILLAYKTLVNLRIETIDLSFLAKLPLETMLRRLTLQSMFFVNVKFTADQKKILSECLCETNELKVLHLNKILSVSCDRIEPKTCSLDLSRNKYLQNVFLSGISTSSVVLETSHLTHCKIDLPVPQSVEAAIYCLQGASNLQELHIRPCRHPNVVKALAGTITHLKNLQRLKLCRIDFRKSLLLLSSEMTNLEYLSLEFGCLSGSSLIELIDSFPSHNFTIKISSVSIWGPNGSAPVKDFLIRNRDVRQMLAGKSLLLGEGGILEVFPTSVIT